MRNFFNNRKLTVVTSIILTLVMTFMPTSRVSASGPVDIAYFDDANFTDRGSTETRSLQMEADTISVNATCAGDDIDLVTCHIVGKTNPNFTTTVTFDADGGTWTFPYNFPEGKYRIYFTGDGDILKTYAIVVFTKWVD